MPLSFSLFLRHTIENPALAAVALLTLGVVLVNGWTDAPNAIAGAVVTGALPFQRAVLLAAACNFAGVLCVTAVNTSVAETIYSIAQFDGGPRETLCALCAALAAIAVWGTAAWALGIPTSESHALVAGISGAAVALNGTLSCIRWGCWAKVLAGLVLSTAVGFWAGRAAQRLVLRLPLGSRGFRLAQIPAAACTALLHGAQDGQKFLGVFLLGTALAQGRQDEQTFLIPLWLMAACALAMALGTALGGGRIIDKVGRQMVSLSPRDGFAADGAGVACLLAATLLGLPVSTTHTRTAALLGVGDCTGAADWRVARSIIAAWLLTFPGCAAVGYCLARLSLALF